MVLFLILSLSMCMFPNCRSLTLKLQHKKESWVALKAKKKIANNYFFALLSRYHSNHILFIFAVYVCNFFFQQTCLQLFFHSNDGQFTIIKRGRSEFHLSVI